MSPERWRKINDLLDEALDLSNDARSLMLNRVGRIDPSLRQELEQLLEADATLPEIFEVDVVDYAKPMLPSPLDDVVGKGLHLGAYRIVREIGKGGMGRVFLAERADGQYQQTVALKVLRPGLDTTDAQRRFQTERQVLASLNHPHIARLFDGGITNDGRPFLVMEYVEGKPIDSFCDSRTLTIEERLNLFIPVVEAIHHAHQKLVVHRDLKPSNIFVTPEGEVKLFDFGIARLLDEAEMSSDTVSTRTSQRWMTPEYAAPEQIRGEAISTATDVYQLGVVLYELLTGHRPFVPDGQGIQRVERAVLDTEPTKPSTAVSRVTRKTSEGESVLVDSTSVSRARGVLPDRLRQVLEGDLDNITLKALSKKPEERYASAEAFVEDIKRHLAGFPVKARTPTAGYRIRSFVRRHRIGVCASALVVLSVLCGLGIALWQARVARSEREEAETLAQALEGIFEEANPVFASQVGAPGLGDLLDRSLDRIETDLTDQPTMQSRMLYTIGSTYYDIHRVSDAERVLTHALHLSREHNGEQDLTTARIMRRLGTVRQQAALLAGESDSTLLPLLRNALSIFQARLDSNDGELASGMTTLADVLRRGTEEERLEAMSLLNNALAIQRLPHNIQTGWAVTTLSYMAEAEMDAGNYNQAAENYTEAEELATDLFGDNHLRTARTRNDLAFCLLAMGRYDEAETYARLGLPTLIETLGDSNLVVTETRRTLAGALRRRGEYNEAERLLRAALEATPNPRERNVTLGSLATLLRERGDLNSAASAQREAIDLQRELLGSDHPMFAYSVSKLARILHEQGRSTESEELLLAALRPLESDLESNRRAVQYLATELTRLFESTGRVNEAMPYRDLVDVQDNAIVH